MRKDMYKVIVERPRRGGRAAERPVGELDESPRCEGLRRRHRYRKWLNENLRPLQRFLAGQVGRPWDKVYAEICAGIDRRHTVQQHIHEHLDDFVAIRVVQMHGQLHWCRSRWGQPERLDHYRSPALYVCPRTGLLRRNRMQEAARREEQAERKARHTAVAPDRRVLGVWLELHRIAGVWYAADLALVAEATTLQARPMDAIRGIEPDKCPAWLDAGGVPSNRTLFGRHDMYAWRKRQLNARELRLHGLANDNG